MHTVTTTILLTFCALSFLHKNREDDPYTFIVLILGILYLLISKNVHRGIPIPSIDFPTSKDYIFLIFL